MQEKLYRKRGILDQLFVEKKLNEKWEEEK